MTDAPSGPRPIPRYQKILAGASRRAVGLGHDYVGTGHLLLAPLADTDAFATQVLGRPAHATEITGALQTVMASESYTARGRHPPSRG
jgi:Clp amino terminal domain, pathogenicity island component